MAGNSGRRTFVVSNLNSSNPSIKEVPADSYKAEMQNDDSVGFTTEGSRPTSFLTRSSTGQIKEHQLNA